MLEQLLPPSQVESTVAALQGPLGPRMHVQSGRRSGGASAADVRQALGLVEVRGQPLFQAAASRKTFSEEIRRTWREWAPEHIPVAKLIIYTDGSALLAAGWPRAVRTAGWSAACFCPDPSVEGGLMFLGAAFAPVLIGVQTPGSFGLLRPSVRGIP